MVLLHAVFDLLDHWDHSACVDVFEQEEGVDKAEHGEGAVEQE